MPNEHQKRWTADRVEAVVAALEQNSRDALVSLVGTISSAKGVDLVDLRGMTPARMIVGATVDRVDWSGGVFKIRQGLGEVECGRGASSQRANSRSVP